MGETGVTTWCILQTPAASTLRLAAWLSARRFTAWTPQTTIKRPAPGSPRRYVEGRTLVMVRVPAPMLPGFVFLRGDELEALLAACLMPDHSRPAFTFLRVGHRVPEVRDGQMTCIRAAEHDAALALAAEVEADTRKAERQARALRLGTERARRKALRRERKVFRPGDEVRVVDAPALEGAVGTVVQTRGTSATIHFGGALTMHVESWRIVPNDVGNDDSRSRGAA